MGFKIQAVLPVILAVLILFCSCGGNGNNVYSYRAPGGVKKAGADENSDAAVSAVSSDDSDFGRAATDVELMELFIIENINKKDSTITVENVLSGQEFRYSYSLATAFLNKYGTHAPASSFKPGMVVELGDLLDNDIVSYIKKSDKVWEYERLTGFEIDTEKNVMTIDGKAYNLQSYVPVYSGRIVIDQKDINENDSLRVYGSGKEIISIAVTKGQGYLSLVNTSLFEDSLIQVGRRVATLITGDMKIALPEGKYRVTVANKGYGGSKKVKIKRGETTTLDLDKIKGDGPKSCELIFKVNAEGAKVYLDGEKVKAGKTLNVPYGVHRIEVELAGYETWKRTLYVNSKSAEISIDPTEGNDTSGGTQSGTSQQSSTENNSQSVNENNNTDNNRDEDNDTSVDDVTLDYLTTLSESLAGMMSD